MLEQKRAELKVTERKLREALSTIEELKKEIGGTFYSYYDL